MERRRIINLGHTPVPREISAGPEIDEVVTERTAAPVRQTILGLLQQIVKVDRRGDHHENVCDRHRGPCPTAFGDPLSQVKLQHTASFTAEAARPRYIQSRPQSRKTTDK
jgi:hypothetical protein